MKRWQVSLFSLFLQGEDYKSSRNSRKMSGNEFGTFSGNKININNKLTVAQPSPSRLTTHSHRTDKHDWVVRRDGEGSDFCMFEIIAVISKRDVQ